MATHDSPETIEELKEFTYVSGQGNQAAMFARTTKAISEYAARNISKNIKLLVKRGKEATFTQPTLATSGTSGDSTREDIEKYKIEQAQYTREVKQYKKEKERIFAIIFNQCSEEVRARLENHPDFETHEDNDDVTALLKLIEDIAYSSDGGMNEYWALQQAIRRLGSISQFPDKNGQRGESLLKYKERFESYVRATEAVLGPIVPSKADLGKSVSDDDKRDKLLAAMFLGGADNTRYSALKNNLHNGFIEKDDRYPTSVSKAAELLGNYLHPVSATSSTGESEGASFTQSNQNKGGKRVRRMPRKPCPKCHKRHPYGPCPDDDNSQADNKLRSGLINLLEHSNDSSNDTSSDGEEDHSWM